MSLLHEKIYNYLIIRIKQLLFVQLLNGLNIKKEKPLNDLNNSRKRIDYGKINYLGASLPDGRQAHEGPSGME